jgi:hypothetical protein
MSLSATIVRERRASHAEHLGLSIVDIPAAHHGGISAHVIWDWGLNLE